MRIWCISIVLAAMFLGGCRVPVEKSVLLLGDSHIANAVREISNQLLAADDAGYLPLTTAIVGTTFSNREYGAEYFVARAPSLLSAHRIDAVVISLGTNDIAQEGKAGQRLSDAELTSAAMRLIDAYHGRPIIWIRPPDHIRVLSSAAYDRVVAAIERAVAARPNVRLVSFTEYAVQRGHAASALVGADRLHLSAEGVAVWAQFIHFELQKI